MKFKDFIDGSTIEARKNGSQIYIISNDPEGVAMVYLDKETAIEFAKKLMEEIDKIEE